MSLQIDNTDEFNLSASLDLYKVHEVMVSNQIDTEEKLKFIRKHHLNISNLVDEKIS